MGKPLHAMNSILSSFRDLKDHPGTLLGISAIFGLPLLIGGLVAARDGGLALDLVAALISLVGGYGVGIWGPTLLISATHRHATGVPTTMSTVIRETSHIKVLRYLGATLLVGLILVGIFLVVFIPFGIIFLANITGSEGVAGISVMGPLFIVLMTITGIGTLVVAFLLSIRWMLVGPSAVLEAKVAKALGRSWKAMRGRLLDGFLLVILIGIITTVISLVIRGPALILGLRDALEFGPSVAPVPSPDPFDMLRGGATGMTAVLRAISSYLAGILALPITLGATTNFFMAIRSEEAEQVPDGRAPLTPLKGSTHTGYVPDSYLRSDGESDPSQQENASGDDEPPGDLPEQETSDEG
jgi:hypothetical protein